MLEAIDETVQIVRKISTELRPGILDDLGLAAAIEWQAKDFQKRSGVLCILNITEEDLDVGREQATAVFRIFPEIVTNIARHSKAERVWIHLHAQEGMVVLEVEDNGVGISPEALSQCRGSGFSACVNGPRCLVARSRSGEFPAKERRLLCACQLMDQPAHENSDR